MIHSYTVRYDIHAPTEPTGWAPHSVDIHEKTYDNITEYARRISDIEHTHARWGRVLIWDDTNQHHTHTGYRRPCTADLVVHVTPDGVRAATWDTNPDGHRTLDEHTDGYLHTMIDSSNSARSLAAALTLTIPTHLRRTATHQADTQTPVVPRTITQALADLSSTQEQCQA